MIQIPIIKIIAYALIPKLVHDTYTFLKKEGKIITKTFNPTKPKEYDYSPWTRQRFDTVIHKRKLWLYRNTKTLNNIPLSELIKDINTELNMNKSQRAIAAIWEGKIDREALPNAKRKSRK